MPKAITIEMLEAMSPDQRKTLHKNALALETPAAREVIALLESSDMIRKPAAAATAPKARAPRKKKATATFGRQG